MTSSGGWSTLAGWKSGSKGGWNYKRTIII